MERAQIFDFLSAGQGAKKIQMHFWLNFAVFSAKFGVFATGIVIQSAKECVTFIWDRKRGISAKFCPAEAKMV